MRILGFIGIFLLLCINIFGFYFAAQARDWKGLFLMLFMAGLLFVFARTLWRGRQLSQGRGGVGPLVDRWGGQSVKVFFTDQVAKSSEGRIFLAGACCSLIYAVLSWLSPSSIGLQSGKSSGLAVLFVMWPVLAFTLYVKVCAPDFRTTLLRIIITTCVATIPFYIAYR